MGETNAFIVLTIILFLLGFMMPFVVEASTGAEITNDISGLSGIEEDGINFTDFVTSVLKAFFWWYGELNAFANLVKLMINFIWGYLLVRLIRGGG